MSQSFTTTGGARVGWTNATWPFARLSATNDRLTISVGLLGTYSFAPEQVSAVERYISIPVLGWGIQIRHCRADYPQRVIFWCLGSPDTLLRRIRDAGFLPAGSSSAIPHGRGIAMRWSAILLAIAVWNALLLLDFTRSSSRPSQPGPFALVALLFAFVLSFGTLISPRLQQLVLKPGRSVGEIRPFLRLLALISGLMVIVFAVVVVYAAFTRRV
jgi:hypothetical protein